jgi:hypothetical protein
LGDDLVDLVGTFDAPLAEVAPLSASGYPGYQPTAFRFRFADGLILKGRRFRDGNRATAVEYISRRLDHEVFPRVVARAGRALLTEWVEGRPIRADDPELLRRCGSLHGLLHAVPVPEDSPYLPCKTVEHRISRLKRRLGELGKAGALERSEAERAFERAVRHAPNSYAAGFAHGDFCAENMVLRSSGTVCVVDNETLAVEAYDYDLARTWYRWPMDAVQRRTYLDAYQPHRSPADFLAHFPFWAIEALVESILFRSRIQRNAAAVPVQRLCALLRDLERGVSAGDAPFQS